MKKILMFALLAVSVLAGGTIKAQNCDDVVLARYSYRADILDLIDPIKYENVCIESKAAFFFPEVLPADAVVIDVTSLTDLKTGLHVSSDYNPTESNLNYFRFDYREKQFALNDMNRDIYIRLYAGEHEYLGVRSLNAQHSLALEMQETARIENYNR